MQLFPALLVLLIPNITADHAITDTMFTSLCLEHF